MGFNAISNDVFSAIVSAESESALPSRRELLEMAKRRFQQPALERHGGYWTIRIRRDEVIGGELVRKQVREQIAPLTEPKREALKLLARKMEPINQQPLTLGSAVTLAEFTGLYKKTVLPMMSKSHASRYRGIIKNYLVPSLGKLMLFDIERQASTAAEEMFVELKSKKFAKETYDKIRDCLSSVFTFAIEKGYATRNPALGLKLPPGRPTPKLKPTITVKQFELIVELIPEPYATMVYVSVYTGLRVSEVIALRWNDIHGLSITVDEKCCRGEWGAPKSDASNATIAVLKKVTQRIELLKDMSVQIGGGRWGYQTFKLVKSSGPNDLVFQGVRSGRSMHDNNILSRHIKPAARQLGIGFVNWQCLRRSHATWLKRAGVPLKDASTQMRHSRTSTTADVYEMTTEEDQVLALEKLETLTTSKAVN